MSKCKEAFDMAVIEHLGPSALAGDKMSIYEAAEIMYRAAWNARGKVDAGIARDFNANIIRDDCVLVLANTIEMTNDQ